MADTKVVYLEGKPQVVPADATDAEISAAFGAIPQANAAHAPKARTWTDTAVDAIPAITGTAGAVIGGAGGTAFGMGVGGIPGAAGGAAVGTAGGEALKQLINRARGADAPSSAGEAASSIAVPALEAGASTAALGGLGKVVTPYIGKGLQAAGGMLESPSTLRQMAGKAVSAAGRAVDANTATPAPKMALDSQDVLRIRELMKAGVPQGDAVRQVWNFKVKNIVGSWTP